MPAPRTPTPEEMFGFGSVPLTSYFGAPEGGSQNPMFSPTARAMLQQGENYQYQQDAIQRQRRAEQEAYQKQQQQQEAERVASQAFGEAPQMTDEQINQQFVQNPAYLQTKQGQDTLGYLKFRQSVTPAADKVLAPQMLKNIEDPRYRAAFQERIQSGVSANEAYEAYRNDMFNEKYALELAAAGVPEEEYAKLRDEKGLFKPDAVARSTTRAKADLKSRESVADQDISVAGKALSDRIKMLKDMGKAPDVIAADPLIGKYTTRLDAANEEKLNTLTAKRAAEAAKSSSGPTGAAAPAKGVIGPDGMEAKTVNPTGFNPTAAPSIEDNQDIVPEEREQFKAEAEKAKIQAEQEAKVSSEITTEWDKNKSIIQKGLESIYGKKDLLSVAKGIQRSATIRSEEGPIPYIETVLKKINPDSPKDFLSKTAFKEPQNKRWGTQDVSQSELLQAWAEQYVRENSGGQSGQAVKPVAGSGSRTEVTPSSGKTGTLIP